MALAAGQHRLTIAENTMARHLIGIDIGSYESKGVLTDAGGRVLASHVTRHELDFVKPGFVEHDAETIWWGEFVAICRALLEQSAVDPHSIAGVGVSAVFSMIPVDARANPLRPGGIMYGVDTRSTREIAAVRDSLGDDTILSRTGNPLTSQSMGPKILWLKNNEPAIYGAAHCFLPAASFIVARLTGAFVIDHLEACFYGPLYDPALGNWAPDLCEGIVEIERLPEVRWACEVAGTVGEEASAATGLAVGTPVTVGTSDVATEALSIGVTRPGETMLMYGSTAWITMIAEKPLHHQQLWSSPYLFPHTYCLHGGTATSGSLTRWVRDQIGTDMIAEEARGGENAYAALTAMARDVAPGSEGLVVLPYFSGERTPVNDPDAKGLIFGLQMHHNRGHLYRAALEGIGYSVNHILEAMREAGADPQSLAAVGGGTASDVWLQAVTDITGLPQDVPEVALGASYGNAFLAGYAVGMFASPEAVHEWIAAKKRVVSRPETADVYARQMKVYRDLYRNTRPQMHSL
jgi:xylulokinase